MNRLAARVLDGFLPPRMPESYVAPTRRGLLIAGLVLTWMFFPGIPVFSALSSIPDIISGRTVSPVGDLSLGIVLTQAIGTLPAVLMAWAVCWACGDRMGRLGLSVRPVGETARDSSWAFGWIYVVTGVASIIIGIVLAAIPFAKRYSAHVDDGGTLSLTHVALAGITLAILAGIVEEVVVLGFSYRTLERLGFSDRTIMTVLIVLRLSYHVYYGLTALSLLPWAWLSIVYYRRYRRLWPVIVGHALWDTWAFVSGTSTVVAGLGVLTMLLFTVYASVLAGVRHHRRPRPLPTLTPYRPVPQWQQKLHGPLPESLQRPAVQTAPQPVLGTNAS